MSNSPTSPLRAVIVPVTPLQQNCTLLWCTATMRAAFVDPGGDLPRLKAAAAQHGVTVEKIILTHGHIDHAGEAKPLADELGVPIEGPHREDAWLLQSLAEAGRQYGVTGVSFDAPDRWLVEGDTVSVGDLTLDVYETPGHTPGHVVFHHRPSRVALVGDVLFQGSVGRTDFPRSDPDALIRSVVEKLWPMGDDTAFIPGHGPAGSFAAERRTNPFVSDAALTRQVGRR
ncbi:MBL fold metallo-hydrolase [uncultured Sphingomonas sp.]|uniref:MBL fold metallo-hydrolase n=1 Tax=uncultured Sphingomonas sp. TaxID=158754 RepID=UPI0035C9F24E